jgi:F-type H+-transporting ATPase subunit a
MDLAQISPDQTVVAQWGWFTLNATILYTWITMVFLASAAWAITRRLTTDPQISRSQNGAEAVLTVIRDQIREISRQDPDLYLPFIGTLFLFVLVSNILTVVPGYVPPTGSLSTTAALAICVFIAVPFFGIRRFGVRGYLRHYVQPTPLMLPFHVLGELSRTLALAVRLFGNVMSGAKIVAILLALIPLVFPILLQALSLLTGVIQAYIFAVLATVYIASATRAQHQARMPDQTSVEKGESS